MNLVFLIRLTESDKRVLIGICIAIILIFVIIGLLGSLVLKMMASQGKKCDTLVSDVVRYRIITNPRQLKRYAAKKNIRYFIKQAWLPILLMMVGASALIIHNSIYGDWTYNPFNMTDGFGTLIFTWDFADASIYSEFFGTTIISDWPPIDNYPHFVLDAIYSYFFVVFAGIGLFWYLIVSQGYLARTIRASKLAQKVFEKSLEDFNQNSPVVNPNQTLI